MPYNTNIFQMSYTSSIWVTSLFKTIVSKACPKLFHGRCLAPTMLSFTLIHPYGINI
uniref:Uncharacterized protein n=1 Tax=Rhizophora mucronata TaxID=61149 RepID=A0A2P2IXR6_RHIMU